MHVRQLAKSSSLSFLHFYSRNKWKKDWKKINTRLSVSATKGALERTTQIRRNLVLAVATKNWKLGSSREDHPRKLLPRLYLVNINHKEIFIAGADTGNCPYRPYQSAFMIDQSCIYNRPLVLKPRTLEDLRSGHHQHVSTWMSNLTVQEEQPTSQYAIDSRHHSWEMTTNIIVHGGQPTSQNMYYTKQNRTGTSVNIIVQGYQPKYQYIGDNQYYSTGKIGQRQSTVLTANTNVLGWQPATQFRDWQPTSQYMKDSQDQSTGLPATFAVQEWQPTSR